MWESGPRCQPEGGGVLTDTPAPTAALAWLPGPISWSAEQSTPAWEAETTEACSLSPLEAWDQGVSGAGSL